MFRIKYGADLQHIAFKIDRIQSPVGVGNPETSPGIEIKNDRRIKRHNRRDFMVCDVGNTFTNDSSCVEIFKSG